MIDRTNLRAHLAAAALAAAVALAGCSSPSNESAAKAPANRTSTGPRGGTGAGGSSANGFERMRDPPIAAETRFAAGQLAESRGALAQAADQYRQAVKIEPKYAQAMYRLGVVSAELKKYSEAIEVWKKYVKLTGESAEAYSNLGFCYELAGRPEEAEGAYEKGVRKDGRSVACRINYGLMLVRRGRDAEGRLHLGAVLSEAEVHYNVGSVYEALGRKQQAKAEYQRALRIDPHLTDAGRRLDELECGPTPANPPGRDAAAGLSPAE